ncbi:hypothetical protein CANARDRAFT_26768 [[Candida] arabinofermentans NRRL YB-2248]|uniref:Hsp90 chaperone protein kinase-targeting subunit n=1 Tax=[Candida] arabinofermentans NRRL YB-2248 TaxID=983967 RepID=A0A1E4T6I0_9ASCO|nr:hypothetical protein CANARDRAFT_26768 [[Candida] arabinofermentans NRRL YB-2248]
MAIDYSKWDKIELSDDSDVEVHPNVDKKSFIKWKQRDIHEKRIQRNNDIKGLKVQKEMYTQLNKRVDAMLKELGTSGALVDEKERNTWLASNFDPKEKCEIEQNGGDNPPYNEMVEDLFTQITDDMVKDGEDPSNLASLSSRIMTHRAKIASVLLQIDPKLEELEREKSKLISSEDIKDGWNSSFINKNTGSTASSAPSGTTGAKSTDKVQVVETINSPGASKSLQKPSIPIEQLDELELLPETKVFSEIPADSLLQSARFLESHLYIVCEHQKDALMMSSFESQLSDDKKKTKQIIHQALILQYLNDLFVAAGGDRATYQQKEKALGLFIGKLNDKGSAASQAFQADLEKTFQHIVNRSNIIKEEQAQQQASNEGGEEGVEQIQLRSIDESTELIVSVPEKGTPEYEIFETLPSAMKSALLTGDLNEINKVFATMSVADAEELLEKFDECGVISVKAVLENEDEFKMLKEEYEHQEDRLDGLNEEENEGEDDVIVNKVEELSTADIVD